MMTDRVALPPGRPLTVSELDDIRLAALGAAWLKANQLRAAAGLKRYPDLQCPEWCELGDDCDGNHWREGEPIPLSAADIPGRVLNVHLSQYEDQQDSVEFHEPPHLVLEVVAQSGESDSSSLTPIEARQLAGRLLAFADVAEVQR